MRLAIAKTLEGIELGQSPFGCCIVKSGRVLACTHNTVWQDVDPSAHAEVNAVRDACHRLDTIDLSGCTVYATCEPCPMCFSVAHWARVSRIVFGASIADAARAGFNEIRISVAQMTRGAGERMKVRSGMLARECRELFGVWARRRLGRPY